MKYVLSIALLLLLVVLSGTVNAATEPVCSYRNSEGDTIFMKFLPLKNKGEEYVDFAVDGKCVKRATCTERFKTEVEDCSKFPISCANKKRYPGVFPACCVKC